MRGQNLYNGTQIVGCRFTFTLPVDPRERTDRPERADGAAADSGFGPAALPSPAPGRPVHE